MAEGGTLAFGLSHVYPMERDLEQVHNVLKGSDAVVYQSVRALGFEPVLYVYDDDSSHNSPPTGVIVDQLSGFYDMYCMISKSRFPKTAEYCISKVAQISIQSSASTIQAV
jgi:hypothetical protein